MIPNTNACAKSRRRLSDDGARAISPLRAEIAHVRFTAQRFTKHCFPRTLSPTDCGFFKRTCCLAVCNTNIRFLFDTTVRVCCHQNTLSHSSDNHHTSGNQTSEWPHQKHDAQWHETKQNTTQNDANQRSTIETNSTIIDAIETKETIINHVIPGEDPSEHLRPVNGHEAEEAGVQKEMRLYEEYEQRAKQSRKENYCNY